MRMPATESSDWLGQHQLARSSRAGLPRRQQAGLQSPHGQPDASDWVPFARLLRTSETLVWLAAALASMRLVPVGTALFAARPVSGAFVCGKPKYVSPTDMKSGGATSTHALAASCSQRSPSLRPVEPISAMPRPRRPPQLSAHAQACSIDHPLCNPSCAVSAPCRRRKEVVSGVLSFSPWVWPAGDGWSGTPVAGRPIGGAHAPGSSLQARRNTVARPTIPLDRGTRAGAMALSGHDQELRQPRFAFVNGRGRRGVNVQGSTSPGALANPDRPRETALYSRWSQLPICR